jgi:acyl carrier protein
MAPTEQEIINLRTALKRCSVETIEAAVRFRATGNPDALPTIVYGIIERHLTPEHSQSLAAAPDSTRLIEDLGVDSLTMLEIVLSIEEAINISIENDELREIRTLGEVKTFITQKISGRAPEAAAGPKTRRYSREDIIHRLPQQPPFLFLNDAEIDGNTVRATYKVDGGEFFLEGHFKDNPVMPASIVFEAVGQAACLWVLENAPEQLHVELKSNEVLFASMEEAHFYRRAKPGDTLEMEAELVKLRAPLAIFRGVVKLHGERLAQIEHLVLAFGHEVLDHLSKKEKEEQASSDAKELPAPAPTPPDAAPKTAPRKAQS